MERRAITCAILAAGLLASPVGAQLGGGLPIDPLGTVGRASDATRDAARDAVNDIAGSALAPVGEVVTSVRELARERAQRLARFVSDNDRRVEWDDLRQPAVRGEALLLAPDPAALDLAQRQGFTVIEQGTLEALDVSYARLAVPGGMPLARAIRVLRKALPGREVSADQLHFPSGGTGSAASRPAPSGPLPRGGTVGVIDGAIAGSRRLVSQRSFAAGSRPSDHASAIASLLAGAGTARIYGADVYGSDPAGGNALAIAKAMGWMLGQGVPVVSISLVGPSNPLLARAIAAARAKGMIIVAAVGNDGAARLSRVLSRRRRGHRRRRRRPRAHRGGPRQPPGLCRTGSGHLRDSARPGPRDLARDVLCGAVGRIAHRRAARGLGDRRASAEGGRCRGAQAVPPDRARDPVLHLPIGAVKKSRRKFAS